MKITNLPHGYYRFKHGPLDYVKYELLAIINGDEDDNDTPPPPINPPEPVNDYPFIPPLE